MVLHYLDFHGLHPFHFLFPFLSFVLSLPPTFQSALLPGPLAMPPPSPSFILNIIALSTFSPWPLFLLPHHHTSISFLLRTPPRPSVSLLLSFYCLLLTNTQDVTSVGKLSHSPSRPPSSLALPQTQPLLATLLEIFNCALEAVNRSSAPKDLL